eukprot:293530_1
MSHFDQRRFDAPWHVSSEGLGLKEDELQHSTHTPTSLIARNTLLNAIPVYSPLSESANRQYNPPIIRKQHQNHLRCCIIIGNSKHYFSIRDLQKLQYFDKRISNHPRNAPFEIDILSNKYQFTMKELQIIVECKVYGEICCDYKFSRIPILINALDYFGEIIDYNIFYQYLLNYFPADNTSIQAQLIANDECYTKSISQLFKAMKMYQNTPNKIGIRLCDQFVTNWKDLPLPTILNSEHLSYRILMRTLRLVKQQQHNQQFVLLIEFIHHRSWTDFRALWKAVLNTRNYVHLLNILWSIIHEYLRKKDLEFWLKHHARYNMYKFKLMKDKHDIGNLTQQMIKRVAYRMFYDKQNLDGMDLYRRFAKLIKKYVKITKMLGEYREINEFYRKLVDKYFDAHPVFHASIVILFNRTYFNPKMVKQRYLQLDDVEKEQFLRSLYQIVMDKPDAKRYQRICEFFKAESWEYITQTLSHMKCVRTPFIALVGTFKHLLDGNNATDVDILDELYQYLIDDVLFECALDDGKWMLVLNVCEYRVIGKRFQKLDVMLQMEFFKYLFRSIHALAFSNYIEMKQKQLMKYLLNDNKRVGLMLFHLWFNILMVEEKHWIINTFLNGSLSVVQLKEVLKTVSETLLIANRYMAVPQEYFDFVNRYS